MCREVTTINVITGDLSWCCWVLYYQHSTEQSPSSLSTHGLTDVLCLLTTGGYNKHSQSQSFHLSIQYIWNNCRVYPCPSVLHIHVVYTQGGNDLDKVLVKQLKCAPKCVNQYSRPGCWSAISINCHIYHEPGGRGEECMTGNHLSEPPSYMSRLTWHANTCWNVSQSEIPRNSFMICHDLLRLTFSPDHFLPIFLPIWQIFCWRLYNYNCM